ncbi:hypothetical protein [Thalassotalea sp. G2M2-11]|uniref:hypothetical protein n=1 Tax=Thalassotalea sp. G2M2-11 TaxID=2787627 RepID=UPI0019D0851B|nr:hypothetical protein [Thalassotalea sp. G2M2-11]
MSGIDIQQLIKSATKGDTVDLKAICQKLKIKIKLDDDLKDYCKVGLDKKRHTTIWLNSSLDRKMKYTFVAIATAELIIDPIRVSEQGVTYDVFFLRELHQNKATKLIMLATRLAVPEHIIEHLSDDLDMQFTKNNAFNKFDSDAYIANAEYIPEFLRCVIKESSSKFLLNNVSAKFH